eukprot:Ihof_evm4s113 gene=Ihof_evmTU4s113
MRKECDDYTLEALKPVVTVPTHLEIWTDAHHGSISVRHVHVLPGGNKFCALVVLSRPAKAAFNLYDGANLIPLRQEGCGLGDGHQVTHIWPADQGLIVVANNQFHSATLTNHQTILFAPLTELPLHLMDDGIAATWVPGRGLVAMALVSNPSTVINQPKIYPPCPPPCHLMRYSPDLGWTKVCSVPSTSEGLAVSANGRYAVWKVMRSLVGPEEACRGDIWGADTTQDPSTAHRITWKTVRVEDAQVSNTGRVVYQGNHSEDLPITTHQDLWMLDWMAGPQAKPTPLTEGNMYIEHWGWKKEGQTLWISVLHGVHRSSYETSLDGSWGDHQPIVPSISGTVSWSALGRGLWPTEDTEHFQSLHDSARPESLSLPHPEGCEDLVVQVVQWPSEDGLSITGVLAKHMATLPSAPLLVHVHGGPATAQPGDRAIATNGTRYPYRQLLQAGYMVFQPMYRGTLGFGNAFAQKLINCQGLRHGDLGDILAGIKYLRTTGINSSEKVGVFGGSYGGYLTNLCMAECPEMFSCGVSMYGFIHNRWMSYEGGDFTFEDEYLPKGRRTVWPMTPE